MGTKGGRKGVARGRKQGGHDKGYWYWKGRRWFATDHSSITPRLPLAGDDGEHLKDPDDEEEAKKAYDLEPPGVCPCCLPGGAPFTENTDEVLEQERNTDFITVSRNR